MLKLKNQSYFIFYVNNKHFDNSKLNLNGEAVLISENLWFRLLNRLHCWRIILYIRLVLKVLKFRMHSRVSNYLGVDDLGYIVASTFSARALYYSLEIIPTRLNRVIFRYRKPKYLIIQSVERMNYLTGGFKNTVYIQNSAILQDKKKKSRVYENKLLYFGTIIEEHGIENCIRTLYKLKNETLTIKGADPNNYSNFLREKYSDLIHSKRLFFDLDYLSQENLSNYLEQFTIGFCFYDMGLIGTNNFNYYSSPSGKVFNYLAHGIPVIGSSVLGIDFIEKWAAGCLLEDPTDNSIATAILEIKNKYKYYSDNSYHLSQLYDYKSMFLKAWDEFEQPNTRNLRR